MVMQKLTSSIFALALALAATFSIAQDKPTAAGGDVIATVNGYPVRKAALDLLVQARVVQGQADTPALRQQLKQELINREVIMQAALKDGLDRLPQVALQLEMVRQGVLVAVYIRDYLNKHKPDEAALKTAYEQVKAQQGDKEYRARHVLVKTEAEAKDIINDLHNGGSFEQIAREKSLDASSKANGGELKWATRGGYVKPFFDALAQLGKGQITDVPVQTQFGWHVIQMQDERPFTMPSYEDTKTRLAQLLGQQMIQKMTRDLRGNAEVVQ